MRLYLCSFLVLLVGGLVLSCGLNGCSGMPSTIIPSTSPIPAGVRGTIPAFGSDCQYNLLGILPLNFSPNTQAALDSAKEDADVDVLTDVTVDYGGSYFILFSNNCVRVRGKGVPREVLAQAIEAEKRGAANP